MTLQIQSPYIHVEDSNGNPYVGATLAVYQAGTTTYADIYSDDALSVALPNPLSGTSASDAAGNFPRVYIAAGTYKLRAETSAGVLIFEEDDIDTGLPAGTGALPISRGGTGATTAAAARAALDVPSNSELTTLSTDISDLQTALQGVVSAPQGRLTLTSGTPVIASDVTAGTAVYYTPDVGALIPIYNGSQFNPTLFTELTLTLSSNHVASTIYDCFVISDSGTVRLVTGPAWNTSTAGSGARGSGAGTTELERINGIYTNKNAMTARNGATTYSVLAHAGTYVGTIIIDGTNGQISQHVTWGSSRKPGPWNAYNRRVQMLRGGDSTASWTYALATIRQSRATTSNTLMLLSGLPDEAPLYRMTQTISCDNTGSSTVPGPSVGVGLNSTTAISGIRATVISNISSAGVGSTVSAEYIGLPFIGINNVNALECSISTNTTTFYGTEGNMMLSTRMAS